MNDIFEEYLREKEPQKKEKGYAWHTAIGLQAVDGLNTSEYLIQTAKKNINGDITFEEANSLIHSYYKENIEKIKGDFNIVDIRYFEEAELPRKLWCVIMQK